MVANSNRALLREELSRRFVPHLQSVGFEQENLSEVDGRTSFPFGIFVRRHGATKDIIRIQFDKYQRAKFTINFRKDPHVVISGNVRSRSSQKESPVPETFKLVQLFRLHPRPKSAAWFAMRTLFGLRSPAKCARDVVDCLMNLFPEVERCLKDGTIGDHVRMIAVPLLKEAQYRKSP